MPGLNVRELGERDFYNLCEREGITVLEFPHAVPFYLKAEDGTVIVLREGDRGLRRLFAAFHELAHHFLHVGDADVVRAFDGPRDSREEREADAFAALAIVPRTKLWTGEWLHEQDDPYAVHVWQVRYRVFRTYGI